MNADEYLRAFSEQVPEWLRRKLGGEDTGKAELIRSLLASRLVYYPGSGTDGSPVALFNRSQAAHCFIYCDSGLSMDQLRATLRETPFLGYEHAHETLITADDFKEAGIVSPAGRGSLASEPVPPCALLVLFRRMAGRDESQGGEAFAVLFLVWDGFDAFEVLFCRPRAIAPPFCVVIQDHGFGGNAGKFGRAGRLERLARRANQLPNFVLVDDVSNAWQGYVEPHRTGGGPKMVEGWRGGVHQILRTLMLRQA